MRRRHRLRVEPEAGQQIAELARTSTDGLETGGAVFGHTSEGTVWVNAATGPGPEALRRIDRFQRDLAFTHRQALDIYERSGSEWVGEWHTHPTGTLVPSGIDLATYQRHLADPDLRFDVFVSIIVGPKQHWSNAMCWMVTSTTAIGHPVLLRTQPRERTSDTAQNAESEETS